MQPNHEDYLVHRADTPAVLSMGREYGMLSTLMLVVIILHKLFTKCAHILQPSRVLYLTPYNIGYYASFLSSAADLQERVIHFGPGVVKDEKLFEVPIGEVNPQTTVVVTFGQDKSHLNSPSIDSDAAMGISDGTTENLFRFREARDYPDYSPCYPLAPNDDTRVPAGTPASATFKMTFNPFNRFAFCESAQDGGYINTGKFRRQLDITKPLFLTVRRHQVGEEYFYHYFKVEIYEDFNIATY